MQNITRYFSFEGRASRKEWWALQARCIFLGLTIIFPIMLAEGFFDTQKLIRNFPEGEISVDVFQWPDPALDNFVPITSTVIKVFYMVYFCVFVTSCVRRLHDMDRSGWWWLIFLIPGIGKFVFTIWVGFFPPVPGGNVPNRYG